MPADPSFAEFLARLRLGDDQADCLLVERFGRRLLMMSQRPVRPGGGDLRRGRGSSTGCAKSYSRSRRRPGDSFHFSSFSLDKDKSGLCDKPTHQ